VTVGTAAFQKRKAVLSYPRPPPFQSSKMVETCRQDARPYSPSHPGDTPGYGVVLRKGKRPRFQGLVWGRIGAARPSPTTFRHTSIELGRLTRRLPAAQVDTIGVPNNIPGPVARLGHVSCRANNDPGFDPLLIGHGRLTAHACGMTGRRCFRLVHFERSAASSLVGDPLRALPNKATTGIVADELPSGRAEVLFQLAALMSSADIAV
jgi:hypothetical protein